MPKQGLLIEMASEALLKGFNKGLDSMKADGSYRKILKDGGLELPR